ncbi:MAG: histidine kinase [Bacteroidetes bacterium]|nr:histidine kinase [Bacteroidota bacterium]
MASDTKSYFQRFRNHPVFYHLLGWACFIFYEAMFVVIMVVSGKRGGFFYGYFLPYAVNIGLFYFHAGFTLRLSFGKRKRSFPLFLLLLVLELLAYLFLMNLINLLSNDQWSFFPSGHTLQDLQPMLRQLWRGIYFIAFSSAYWLVSRSSEYQKRVLEMEKMQLINLAQKNKLERNLVETENAYLRAQINPHLLFNTLNFIYNNVQQASTKASEAVVLLSDLMNYSLREPEADGKTSLEKEIEQILNLIRINQIRFENKLFLDVEVEGDFSDVKIIPLLIVVFVENVFKHGDLTEPENAGKITISYEDGCLQLFTVNKKKKRTHIASHGIGLTNIKKRLEKEYGDHYRIDIRNDETHFYLHLSIRLAAEEEA